MATTDVHMQLLGHAYVSDSATRNNGLSGLATLIETARRDAAAEGRATLLLDNGDLLQGTALGSWAATQPVTASHPVAASLNAMGYDAIGLGNHDLDYGLAYLDAIAAHLDMPMICSNLQHDHPSALQSAALVDCPVPDTAGDTLRVGVLSVLPEQTAVWNRHVLHRAATVTPALACVQAAIPRLRAQGADLIVLLAHMGIDDPSGPAPPRDSALPLARISGVDAIITGHTHRRFPGNDHRADRDIDTDGGTLARCPASMPGYSGSDLAVLDLTLNRTGDEPWTVIGHISRLIPNTGAVAAAPAVLAACKPAHDATRAHLATPVATTPVTLQNYFSLAVPTAPAELVARAKVLGVSRALAGTPEAALPLVATASAHTAGGREGPGNFLNIPAGDVLRRHIAGLDPYTNEVRAVRVTGATLHHMLEHAARIYTTLRPDAPAQPLVDPRFPSFDFDTIYGLQYTIDPSRPPGQRITSVLHDGRALRMDQAFILATNQFRVAGGGGYPPAAQGDLLSCRRMPLSEAAIDALHAPGAMQWPVPKPWKLICATPRQAMLATGPEAQPFLTQIAEMAPHARGLDENGFLQIQITL
ncbi:bifunctional metallophosphatase/5'-nucleotidase [Sulfitobacter sp. JB4-11]|uniref:bifunctional metallophosphatase/5'-nucleotidase n=1 Tax=Sulfitobacter rhodophyticola TaxID=3238304 RepID=UPI003A6C8281